MRTPLFIYRWRKHMRRANLSSFMMLAAGIAGVVVAGLILLDEVGQDGRIHVDALPSREMGKPQNDAPPPPGPKLADRTDAAVADEMRQRPQADLSGLPAFEVSPPLNSVDGSGFRWGDDTVRFDRVSGPRASDICLDGELRWSCGLQARAALHNLAAGRTMLCQPRRVLTGGGIAADCRLGAKGDLPSGDVSRLLVQLGWAQPEPGGEAEFAADLAGAKASRAGLWRGGWRVLKP